VKLGKVVGRVVCTVKHESLHAEKLLLLQPLDEHLAPAGDAIVACDTVQAGEGDTVYWEGSKEAAKALKNWYNPADAAIIAIVDAVNVAAGGAAPGAPP
jgi:ethanolamine utilization protein EutN